MIVKAAFDTGRIWAGIACLTLLGVIFAAMAAIVLGMALGPMPKMRALRGYLNYSGSKRREPMTAALPPLILAGMVLCLGLYLPPGLRQLLDSISVLLGGGQ